MNFRNLTIKRPDVSDLADLAPVAVALALWTIIYARSGQRNVTMLLPALVALAVWVCLKGLRYVPR